MSARLRHCLVAALVFLAALTLASVEPTRPTSIPSAAVSQTSVAAERQQPAVLPLAAEQRIDEWARHDVGARLFIVLAAAIGVLALGTSIRRRPPALRVLREADGIRPSTRAPPLLLV